MMIMMMVIIIWVLRLKKVTSEITLINVNSMILIRVGKKGKEKESLAE